jgi:hypothetical protein
MEYNCVYYCDILTCVYNIYPNHNTNPFLLYHIQRAALAARQDHSS